MNERDYSVEALIDAEDQDSLEPWDFEQSDYTIVEDSYELAVVQKVKSALGPCDEQSISAVCALVTALKEDEKSIEQLTYELGFGSRISLFQPYLQMALESELIERVGSTDKTQEYWKIAR